MKAVPVGLHLVLTCRYGALLHILAFTPLRRHSRQQQEDTERQRVLEALHPDPDYDDPEPETRNALSHHAPAQPPGRTETQTPNLAVALGPDGHSRENGESFDTVLRNKNDRLEGKRSPETETGRSRRYQKRKSEQAPERLPRSLHSLGHRKPVDLYDTFRLNTLKHRRSVHAQF